VSAFEVAKENTSTVVLVHGAWHGAWCWSRVIAGLAEHGVPAVAVELPGHGQDRGRLGDLYGDAERLRSVLDSTTGPVVLVGHSYGGAVITEAGSHPAVVRLVYLAAFALDVGESCRNAAAVEVESAAISHQGRPDLGAGFVIDADGIVMLDPEVAEACLYGGCDGDTVAWALARLGPQPLITFRQPVTAAARRSVPSSYVVCANDLCIHPDLQRLLARRCTASTEWPTGHSPFLSHPQLVVELLVDLARPAT
jgi:pimeloyl-ACP methyl ester carboxylesterase